MEQVEKKTETVSTEENQKPSLPTINMFQWIIDNSKDLKPPVNNKCMALGKDFLVMIVGGPNERSDYHINTTEEWFYQIKGDLLLKTVDDKGVFHETWVREGHTILLPGNVPHNPCRFENTVGLVIERIRNKDQIDALRWYCKECKKIVYEESFNCVDIQNQLKEVINKYAGSEQLRTCANCKYLNPPF